MSGKVVKEDIKWDRGKQMSGCFQRRYRSRLGLLGGAEWEKKIGKGFISCVWSCNAFPFIFPNISLSTGAEGALELTLLTTYFPISPGGTHDVGRNVSEPGF